MISTKGRYAVRILVDIAERGKEERIPLSGIADRQGMSLKYLQHIAKLLVRAGILVGVSGKGGGYNLARPKEQITVLEVLEAAEGTIAPVACLAPGASACEREQGCKTLPMWKKYDEMIRDFFGNISIADVADGRVGDDLIARLGKSET